MALGSCGGGPLRFPGVSPVPCRNADDPTVTSAANHRSREAMRRPRRLEPTEDGTAAVSIAVALLSRERRRRPACDGLRCLPARPGPDDLLEQREQEEEEVGSQCRYREAA
ncbi:unnamed protein product [Lampetra fluviatilis]